MPIRPENRDRYPANWPDIAKAAKDAAQWLCICDGRCGWRNCGANAGGFFKCYAEHGEPHPITGTTAVLTVAHLDHTPEHCDDDNLMPMCQGCHLSYDRQHHAETARATREAAKLAAGQETLL